MHAVRLYLGINCIAFILSSPLLKDSVCSHVSQPPFVPVLTYASRGFAALLQQLRDQTRPARLMARPNPAPLSPWKYSWNKTRSRQCGSVWNFSELPIPGRRPSSSLQENTRQPPREFGRHFPQRHHLPEPVGHSTLKSSPK